MSNPVRIQIAETGKKPPYEETRVAWFYFVYDWETRSKQVFENSDLFEHPEKYPKNFPPNTHLYKIHVDLQPPVGERQETELTIDVAPYIIEEMDETKAIVEPEKVAYSIARHFFFDASRALPKNTYKPHGTGAALSFGGKNDKGVWDTMKPEFEITCPSGKFRVTVEKIG